MKCSMVFDDWRVHGKSVYATELGLKLSSGDLHGGSTFPGEITLDAETEAELLAAHKEHGAMAIVWVIPDA